MEAEEIFYRRRLPHWQPPGATIFITWRLYGSLSREVIGRLTAERTRLDREPKRVDETAPDRESRHNEAVFKAYDDYLDHSGHEPLWMRDERISALVTNALFHFNGERYDLIAFVVMANHVHVLLTPRQIDGKDVLIRTITQGLKGYTAREANKLLSRTGQRFWQEESFDRWARNRTDALRFAAYIENNPVTAGLAKTPEEWQWSSAWERAYGRLVGMEL